MVTSIAVGLSQVRVSSSGAEVLVAYSLGSCVGLAMWDPVVKAGGMAHVVLPSSRERRMGDTLASPGKFADTAAPHLALCLEALGCRISRLQTWMAGGAHVLKGLEWKTGDIGAANVKGVLEALEKLGLHPQSADVGKDYGRTMRLYTDEGRVTISSHGRGERDI